MRRICGLLCALWFILMGAPPALADDWIRAESEHFIVHSNDSEIQTRRYLTSLENYRYTLNHLYLIRTGEVKESGKFELFIVKRQTDYTEVRPNVSQTTGGFYARCEEGAIAFSTSEYREENVSSRLQRTDKGHQTELVIIFHEYAHHFMFDTYSTAYPSWFIEGFAEYFSTMRFGKESEVNIGIVSQDRYTSLMTSPWLPYADIIAGTAKRDRAEDRAQFYAQSWLLAHYILSDTTRVKAFGLYLDAYNAGADPLTAFETHMGVKPADMDKLLRAYLSKGVPVISFKFNDMPVPDMAVTALSKSADPLILWQATLKTCPRGSYGPVLLENIRKHYARFANDELAQLTYARAEILLGDPQKAEPVLTAFTAAQPEHAEAQYLLGRYHLAQGRAIKDAKASEAHYRKARAALSKAYSLEPLSAPTLFYLAQAQESRDDFPNLTAQNAAIQASNLMPSSDDYAVYASQLLIHVDRAPEAAILLKPVAHNPHGGETAQKLKLVIAAIEAGKPKAELLTLLEEAAN